MNIFDSDADDGLGAVGAAGLVLLLGFGAWALWQVAYERGARDVLRFGSVGCIVTMPDGKKLTEQVLRQRERITVPKEATLTGACLNPT